MLASPTSPLLYTPSDVKEHYPRAVPSQPVNRPDVTRTLSPPPLNTDTTQIDGQALPALTTMASSDQEPVITNTTTTDIITSTNDSSHIHLPSPQSSSSVTELLTDGVSTALEGLRNAASSLLIRSKSQPGLFPSQPIVHTTTAAAAAAAAAAAPGAAPGAAAGGPGAKSIGDKNVSTPIPNPPPPSTGDELDDALFATPPEFPRYTRRSQQAVPSSNSTTSSFTWGPPTSPPTKGSTPTSSSTPVMTTSAPTVAFEYNEIQTASAPTPVPFQSVYPPTYSPRVQVRSIKTTSSPPPVIPSPPHNNNASSSSATHNTSDLKASTDPADLNTTMTQTIPDPTSDDYDDEDEAMMTPYNIPYTKSTPSKRTDSLKINTTTTAASPRSLLVDLNPPISGQVEVEVEEPVTYLVPEPLKRIHTYLHNMREVIILRLITTISIRNINHENMCCLNTALLILLIAQLR